MRSHLAAIALTATAWIATCSSATASDAVPEYTYQIVHTYPHDSGAFTQGLVFQNGVLYEGTGLEGESTIRKVKLETGEILQRHAIPPEYFGEGIVLWK